VLGFSPLSAGPLSSTPPFVPAEVRPPSFGGGALLGFGPIGSAPLATVPTFPPPDVAFIVGLVEAASAADIADAVVVPAVIVSIPGGGYRAEPLSVVEGYGYGILPGLRGEAHGVVLPAKGDDPGQLDELLLLLLTAA
jgi:hypothetical protein